MLHGDVSSRGGRQKDQSRGSETLQGRCEDGTTQCGETLEMSSYWLGAFDKSRRRCRAVLSFGIIGLIVVWSAVEFGVSGSAWAFTHLGTYPPSYVPTWQPC